MPTTRPIAEVWDGFVHAEIKCNRRLRGRKMSNLGKYQDSLRWRVTLAGLTS